MKKLISGIVLSLALTGCGSGPSIVLPTDWSWIPAGYKGEMGSYTKVSDFNVAFRNTADGMQGSDKWTSTFYTFVSKMGCSDYLEVTVNFTRVRGADEVTKSVVKRVNNLAPMFYQQILFINEGVTTAGGVYVSTIVCKQKVEQ